MRDLVDRADGEQLVTAVCRAALADPLLGPVFTEVAKLDLTRHRSIMCDLWQTVLIKAGINRRNAPETIYLLRPAP